MDARPRDKEAAIPKEKSCVSNAKYILGGFCKWFRWMGGRVGGPSSCHENIFLQPTPISPPLLVAVVWTGRRICQQCFFYGCHPWYKTAWKCKGWGHAKTEKWLHLAAISTLFQMQWVDTVISYISRCGCISECVKNSFFVYSYVGVTGSWIVLGKEFWLDRCCWSAHAQAQCDMEQVTISDAGAFALVFIDCWMSRIWVSLTVWFVSSTFLVRLCSQGTKNIQVHCRIAERKCLWYQRKWCKCPS